MFASYKDIKENNLKYGVAVSSGTDALYIALLGLGIKQGDEIITVSNTAIPTVSAIRNCGAKARFVDIGSDYLINTDNIEKYISKNTKAIIPVHLYGQACDMEKICKIAKKHKLKIIEAQRLEISVDDYELNNYVEAIFGISSEKSEEFKQYLISIGIDHDIILEQAKAEVLWKKLINERFSSLIVVSEDEIKKEKEKYKKVFTRRI